MKFGENLYNLRKKAKMSQEQLAEKVSVSRQSISYWENGENYPEMEKILKLCEIFHCKINDLVHEDLSDIDLLDEDIKMNIVKFKQEKQKKMKKLSKAIYIIAKIGKILTIVALPIAVIVIILGMYFLGNLTVENGKLSLGNIIKEEFEIIQNEENNHTILKVNDQEIDLDEELKDEMNNSESIYVKSLLLDNLKSFNKETKVKLMVKLIIASISVIGELILLIYALKHLEKLFLNIHTEDTPFILENVKHMKNMTYFLIGAIIVKILLNGMLSEQGFGFDSTEVLQILFLYSMKYIFEYGYEIQLDSKGKIYGNENE